MIEERLQYADAHVWHAIVGGDLSVANWFGVPNVTSARAQMDALLAHVRSRKDKVGLLTILDAGLPLPDEATRTVISDSVRSIEAHVTRQSMVIEGSGFGASAIRAMIAGMSLVVRAPYPIKVFDNVASAVAWTVQPSPARGRELEEAIAAARRRYGKAGA